MGCQNRELLVVEYAPNLKIVGCYHALCDRDKKTLDSLVHQSEFLALEWDEIRQRTKGEFNIIASRRRQGFDAITEGNYRS